MSTNINSLLSFANQLSSSITAEARWMMEQEGTIQPGQDPVDALTGQSNNMVSDTMQLLTNMRQANPDIPLIRNNEYLPPAILGQTISTSRDFIAQLQERMANNPDWKGDRSAMAQEELEIQQTQNTLMLNLVDSLNVLNENTVSLPTLLTNIVNSSNESNRLISAMNNSINSIQEMLLRLEQNLAAANNAEQQQEGEQEGQ